MSVTQWIMLHSLYVGLSGSREVLRVRVRTVCLDPGALLHSDTLPAKLPPPSRNLPVPLLRGPEWQSVNRSGQIHYPF